METEYKIFGLGVIIFIMNKEFSKILLLKRNAQKRKRNGLDWGNVGGRVEFGEYLSEACIREAKEEIGINIDSKNLKLIEVKETPHMTKTIHAIHFVYATILDEKEKITLNNESEEYGWFDLKNLPDKTLDSKETLIKWGNIVKNLFYAF